MRTVSRRYVCNVILVTSERSEVLLEARFVNEETTGLEHYLRLLKRSHKIVGLSNSPINALKRSIYLNISQNEAVPKFE